MLGISDLGLGWAGNGFSLKENLFCLIKVLGLADWARCGPIFLFVLG